MKIRIVLPTLRSGGKFAAVLEQMRDFASGKHDISWNVVCNQDDADTLRRMPSWVICWPGPAAVPYMQRCNEAALAGEFDWLMQWTDDTWTLTCWWDEYIASLDGAQTPLVSWKCAEEPHALAAAVMTPRFAAALGKPFTTWFPFWFTDVWTEEVHRMAFGAPVPFVDGLEAFGKRGKTRVMRELRFWAEFFRATRPERLQQARRVMKAYGVVRGVSREQMEQFDEFDRRFAKSVDEFEAAFKPADEEMPAHYSAMRAAAESHLWLVDAEASQRYCA